MKKNKLKQITEIVLPIICVVGLIVYAALTKDNEIVVFDKNNIEDSFWGQDGKLLICNIYENIKKLNQLYPISDLKELFNSFYFWEYNIKLAIQKSYTKRIFSNTKSRNHMIMAILA